MHMRALQRPQIADLLDDTDHVAFPVRIGTHAARIAAVEVAAC